MNEEEVVAPRQCYSIEEVIESRQTYGLKPKNLGGALALMKKQYHCVGRHGEP
jgi:hypothetical protein